MGIEKIAIYGAGGFGREIAWLIEECNKETEKFKIVCFIDDDTKIHEKILNNIPVMSFEGVIQKFPSIKVVSGIGVPQTNEKLMIKSQKAGFNFQTIIHPRTEYSRWIDIGDGTLICAGSILTTNISIGKQVQINLDCTIGHDVVLGDYTTLAPGVHISGCVQTGMRVYIGTGAVIINGTQDKPLIIDDDAVIGAAACVTKSIPKGLTVAGIPAKPLKK